MKYPVIHSTKDYDVVLLDDAYREDFPDANYGIVNREYGTVEATMGVLYAVYAVLEDLQEKLDEHRPKASTLHSIN